MSFFDRYIAHGFRTSSVAHMSAGQLANNRELLYDSFAFDNWNNMGFQDKVKCLQALENDFAGQQGRPALPVRTTLEDCYGYYSPTDNVIYVNENYIDHGNFDSVADAIHPARPDANIQLFDTIAHEGYHGYQNYAMRHPEVHSDKHQLSEWAMNEGKYYDSRNSGDKYYLQPQERDAWAYGYEKTAEAFDGIEARNGNEPGMHDYEKMASLSSYDEAKIRAESLDSDVLSNMESEMKTTCESRGIDYDYEDPNVIPTMVEDKANYGVSSGHYKDDQGDIDEDNQSQNQRDTVSEDSFDESLADDNTEQEANSNDWNEGAEEMPSEENAEQEEHASDLAEGVGDSATEESAGQEEQASDLTEGADESPAEENVEQEEQASDLMEGVDESPTEETVEQKEEANDLTESADESIAAENAEQEEQAGDMAEGANESLTEENSEQEEQESDLMESVDESPSEENTEQEEQTSDLSGEEATDESGSEGESSEEDQSYSY